MLIRSSRLRAKDLQLVEHFGLEWCLEQFREAVTDVLGCGATYVELSEEMGTIAQNVRNWHLGRCKPEGANLSRLLRWTIVECRFTLFFDKDGNLDYNNQELKDLS